MKSFRQLRDDGALLINAYVATVTTIALAAFIGSLLVLGIEPLGDRWLEAAVLLAVLVWSEMRPINILRAGTVEHVVASTTFAFTIFLVFGVVPAMVSIALASLTADVLGRKPPIKVMFNVAQYWVAWGAAGAVFAAVGSGADAWQDELFTSRWYLAVLAAGATYFAVNNLLVGLVVGISSGGRVWPEIRSTFTSEWSTDVVLLALAPIVVIVAEQSIVALPLLLLPIVAVYRSVSISAEKQYLALHDPLTDLPNRFSFTSVLAARVEAAEPGTKAAVILFDLDHFKDINDTLGHQAGDDLLRMIGPRMSGVLPDGSTVARLGGDEFAVLVPALSGPHDAFRIARSIADALREPFTLEGFSIEVKGSIGIAIHPDDGADGDALVKNADIAMYVAKSHGTLVERYDEELDHHSTRRLQMVGEMRNAIADGDMLLYYQPKLGLADRDVTEVEALVRWVHPRLGLVEPSEFVPLSEHAGLIRQLTTHVLREAVEQISRWRAAGLDLVVAVNLSARGLHDGTITDEVAEILGASDIPPQLLRLEITEGSIMADPEQALRVLEQLAQMGVRLSVDDFGTGYSSLAYLQRLPVDELKIDRSFIAHLVDSEGDRVIVRAIIDLARNLGLSSVAEGVEAPGTLRWLADARCGQAQGYHIARPMPAGAFTEWLTVFRNGPSSDEGVVPLGSSGWS